MKLIWTLFLLSGLYSCSGDFESQKKDPESEEDKLYTRDPDKEGYESLTGR